MSTPTGNHHTTTMAISESNSSRGDQLAQLYQLLDLPDPLSGGGGEGTALGSTPPLVRPTAAAAGFTDGGGMVGSGGASTGGGAGKAVRRRMRPANRRTPTTVLTTDAVNFRAMVQQFTGVHQAPFPAGGGGGGGQAASAFGVVAMHRQPGVFPFGVLHRQQLHRNEERALSGPGGSGHRGAAAGGDVFLQGIAGEPQMGYAAGFRPENIPPPSLDQMTPRTAASPGLPFW